MYCKECGKHIADGSKFCSYCGTKHENNLANNVVQTITANKFVQICSKCNTKETPLLNSNNEICGSVCLKCNTDVINGKCPNCHRGFKNYKDVSCSYCGSSWKREESKIEKLPTIKFTEFPPIQKDTSLKCPKCGSNQIIANKKGFSGGKALVGGLLTGGVGLLAGTIGSSKMIITCLQCGYKYNAGDYKTEKYKFQQERERAKKIAKGEQSYGGVIFAFLVFSIIGFVISYKLFANEWYFIGFIFSVATLLCVIMLVTGINSESARNKGKISSNTDDDPNLLSDKLSKLQELNKSGEFSNEDYIK